jgi:hypothetical protein
MMKTDLAGETKVLGNIPSQRYFSTLNSTRIGLGLNSGHSDEIPAFNRLRGRIVLAVSIGLHLEH